MKTRTVGICVLAIVLGACTPQNKQETRQDLKKTGDAVKKELKNDAAFVKEEALKARQETQKGVKKLKKEMDEKKAEDAR